MITTITISILSIIILALLNVRVQQTHVRKYKDTLYRVNQTNESTESKKAVLFHMNRHLLSTNLGSDNGIKTQCGIASVSYMQLLQQSASQPFTIYKTVIKASVQVLNNLSLKYERTDANGAMEMSHFFVRSYVPNEAEKYDRYKVEIENEYAIDGNSELSYNLAGNEKVEFEFYYKTYSTINVKLYKHLIYKLKQLLS